MEVVLLDGADEMEGIVHQVFELFEVYCTLPALLLGVESLEGDLCGVLQDEWCLY